MQKFDVRRQAKQELEEIGFCFNIQLLGFNNNITTTSFHHSSDISTILKKIFDAMIFFKKVTNMFDINATPGSKRLYVTANFLQYVTPG